MNKVIAFLRLINFDNNHRWYCGYVGVKDDSMLPKSFQGSIDMLDDYPNSLDAKISVHGGITFDGTLDINTPIIPLTDIPADWYTYHYYGFDVNHYDDKLIATNFEYAKSEALNMKEQMEELIAAVSPSTGY